MWRSRYDQNRTRFLCDDTDFYVTINQDLVRIYQDFYVTINQDFVRIYQDLFATINQDLLRIAYVSNILNL